MLPTWVGPCIQVSSRPLHFHPPRFASIIAFLGVFRLTNLNKLATLLLLVVPTHSHLVKQMQPYAAKPDHQYHHPIQTHCYNSCMCQLPPLPKTSCRHSKRTNGFGSPRGLRLENSTHLYLHPTSHISSISRSQQQTVHAIPRCHFALINPVWLAVSSMSMAKGLRVVLASFPSIICPAVPDLVLSAPTWDQHA
ncbi:hypothetical protein GGI42DRAFT_23654 [Trichoderma sp. SZMC 28013]